MLAKVQGAFYHLKHIGTMLLTVVCFSPIMEDEWNDFSAVYFSFWNMVIANTGLWRHPN